jgi:hypothetical protein
MARPLTAHTGETEEEVLRTTRALSKHGVGSILDYAAEDDVENAANAPPDVSEPPDVSADSKVRVATELAPAAVVAVESTGGAVARQYAYAK